VSIAGNLRTMAFADIVQWIAASDKTGTLVIDGPKYTKRIYFSRSSVVAVSSDNPREMLGYYLVGWGHLTDEMLQDVIELQKQQSIGIGELVVKLGYLTKKDLERVVQVKVLETINDLICWEEGNFRFVEGQLPERDLLRIQLPTTSFLYEGYRQRDELQRMRSTVPSARHIPVCAAEPAELTPHDKVIWSVIDDATSIEHIALRCRVPVFTIMSFVHSMVGSGALRLDPPTEHAPPVPGQSLPAWQDLADDIEDALQRDRLLDALELVTSLRERHGDSTKAAELAAEVEYTIEEKLDNSPLSTHIVLEATVGLDELMNLDCAPAEGFVLSRINASYTVAEVLAQLPGSTLRNRLILHNLLRRGLVKVREITGVKPL